MGGSASFSLLLLIFGILFTFCSSQYPSFSDDLYYKNELPFSALDPDLARNPLDRNNLTDENSFGSRQVLNTLQPQQCYDQDGKAQFCKPPFENAAYRKPIQASNTCGENEPIKYCQIAPEMIQNNCSFCLRGQHPPEYMNDNDNSTLTWWQSETMLEGIQYPNVVNITLKLGKAFEINIISFRFMSPRPESMAIYKKLEEGSEWEPFHFFSSSCKKTFNMTPEAEISENLDDKPTCTSDDTDMIPLSRSNVVFSNRENRRTQESHALKEFMTASELRIQLTRLNTFGDERYGRDESLQSYYYAISDLEVGGHCKCNGHASECVPLLDDYSGTEVTTYRLQCRCQHNTTGRNCERCADFYNDAPWGEATFDEVHECRRCECNERSNRCVFDWTLYEQTGRGGRCIDCEGNTEGQHCENCKRGYYRDANGECVHCGCDLLGSVTEQCEADGQCLCKQGVEGSRCTQCAPDHYDFGVNGCRSCACNRAGSFNNTPSCNPNNGQCACKANVEGQHCDKCKLGHFDLQPDHEFGCLSCFCYDHTSDCASSIWYTPVIVESSFLQDADHWTGIARPSSDLVYSEHSLNTLNERSLPLNYSVNEELIFIKGVIGEQVYFVAGEQFTGDQRFSYNQKLSFELRIDEEPPRADIKDIILEGANGLSISQPIFGQNNPLPSTRLQHYEFKLHESIESGWTPTLTSKQFLELLSNITSLKIRSAYTPYGSGFLHSVRLESAMNTATETGNAHWVETCNCPSGYVGQFCEDCKPGYRHEPRYGGAKANCVPCECNGHSDFCEIESGICACWNNTAGASCERCASGFYGDALSGKPDACHPCPCPDGGACVELATGEIACLTCPPGYGGLHCEQCVDGYYGSTNGTDKVCLPCECNDNVDANALGNCDEKTGECLKCVFNTYGTHCEKCLQGYYGNPLALPKGDCRPCECHVLGTIQSEYQVSGRNYETALLCDQLTGQCNCKSNVWGRQCDQCMPDYFNISHPEGCQSCECDPIGSMGRGCDATSGQCECKPGVGGLKCDQCLPFHYGFSMKGCSRCDCDELGSLSPSCDANGQCPCRPHVEGRHCERCRENRHSIAAGCEECPTCYRLVQARVIQQRARIGDLQELLAQIERHPPASATLIANDGSFERQLSKVSLLVSVLAVDARNGVGRRAGMANEFDVLKQRMESLLAQQSQRMFMPNLTSSVQRVRGNLSIAEDVLERTRKLLQDARRQLDEEGLRALNEAAERTYGRGAVGDDHAPQRLTELARQARKLADQRTNQAVELLESVARVVNISESADSAARAALRVHSDNQVAVEQLRTQFIQAHDTLEKTKRMAEESQAHASRAYNASIDLRSKATSLELPSVQASEEFHKNLQTDADKITKKAGEMQSQLTSVLNAHQLALNQSTAQLSDARQLLSAANDQQHILSQLQLTANLSLATAKGALDKSAQLLKHAETSLNTLQSFHLELGNKKTMAKESLEKLPSIRSKVEEIEQKQTEVGTILETEQRLAVEAKNVADGAASSAIANAKAAEKMLWRTIQGETASGELVKMVTQLTEKVKETAKDIEESERQTESDSELAREALEKANQAKTKANQTSKKINETIFLLDKILVDLENLDEFDSARFKGLDIKLKLAEEEIIRADIDSRIASIRAARDHQKNWLLGYEKEITRLTKDVENVNQIRLAIPEKCFRDVILEP